MKSSKPASRRSPPYGGRPLPRAALAAEWPTKPIRVIVPFSPGSATDLIPRAIFEHGRRKVGQTIHRRKPPRRRHDDRRQRRRQGGSRRPHHPGALERARDRAGDPGQVPYDPVQRLFRHHPARQRAAGAGDLAGARRSRRSRNSSPRPRPSPGSINYAAAGIGTPPHLTMERFRLAAGFEGQLVPFRGAPEALTEVMTGRVDIYFCPITPAMPFIQDGKLLALAVSSSKRASALPNVPTTVEAGFPEFRFRFLDRSLRAEEDPARRGRQHAPGDRQGDRKPGREGAARQARRRADDHASRRPSTRASPRRPTWR